MSENRAFFRDTVDRILADTLTQKDIEATERRQLPAGLCAALIENGIMMMLVSQEAGGVGADLGDAVAIVRALGAAAAPGPLVETLVAQWLLAEAGKAPVDGLVSLAFDREDGRHLFDQYWGGVADHVLVVTPGGLYLTATGDWHVEKGLDIAGEPRDHLSIDTRPPAFASSIAFDHAFRTASLLRAAQILGAVEWTLTRSIEYAGERKQFGREISRFQVVQQMLAELADHVLASSGIIEAAGANPGQSLVAAARSRVADAADCAIAVGHQVHGALGFSREYALNHRTRRLMAWRDDYGTVPYWRRTLASDFVTCTREEFWPALSDAGLLPAG
jgi:acyl-CoA dehydrogenase